MDLLKNRNVSTFGKYSDNLSFFSCIANFFEEEENILYDIRVLFGEKLPKLFIRNNRLRRKAKYYFRISFGKDLRNDENIEFFRKSQRVYKTRTRDIIKYQKIINRSINVYRYDPENKEITMDYLSDFRSKLAPINVIVVNKSYSLIGNLDPFFKTYPCPKCWKTFKTCHENKRHVKICKKPLASYWDYFSKKEMKIEKETLALKYMNNSAIIYFLNNNNLN